MLVHLRTVFKIATLSILSLCLSSPPAMAQENAVVVESKTVVAGDYSVWIGISISNDFPVFAIFLPLEVRAITPGSFISEYAVLFDNPSGRVAQSGLSEDEHGCWPWPSANPTWHFHLGQATQSSCSGPVSNTYTNAYYDIAPFVSPDGFSILADGSSCGPLAPGTDPVPSESASFAFKFAVTTALGQFEIDTCCVIQSHLAFGDLNGHVVPQFTKGIVTIVPCVCPCAADPLCDSSTDVSDVAAVIDVAFRGVSAISDSTCPVARTDVNADGATDVVDVVRTVYVAFYGQSGATYFSNPCQ